MKHLPLFLTRSHPYVFGLAIAVLGLAAVGCAHRSSLTADQAESKTYELWEPTPAPNRGHDFSIEKPDRGYPYDEDWETWSYPIGNGNLGASIFGRTDVERIQLTEKSFDNSGSYGRGGLTSAAELYLDLNHGAVSDYRRALNLNDAIATVAYSHDGTRYEGEYFTSYPDDVLVVRLTADQAGALSFTIRPEIPYLESRKPEDHKTGNVTVDDATITLAGTIDYFNLNYQIQVRVLNDGGSLLAAEGTLQVEQADAVTLLVAVDTNYKLSPEVFLADQQDKLDPELDPRRAPIMIGTVNEREWT